MESETGARRGFFDDLNAAFAVWRSHPALPGFSLLIFAVPGVLSALALGEGCPGPRSACGSASLDAAAGFSQLAAFVFMFGWVGVERLWYLRSFRGLEMRPAYAWQCLIRFSGRYLILGLLVGLVTLPVGILAFRSHRPPLVVVVLVSLAIDLLLTFVTPALAFSTKSAVKAIGLGFRTAHETWPASAPYVLVPPLAVFLVARVAPASFGRVVSAVATVGSVLLTLAFKGATAAFYLRVHEVGDDGAALIGKTQRPVDNADWFGR